MTDQSLAPAEALVRSAHELWHDQKDRKYTITAEQENAAWRMMVIVDEPGSPVIQDSAGRVELLFHHRLDGDWVGKTSTMMAAAARRKIDVRELLIAHRYHCSVRGRAVTVVHPMRTVASPDGKQSFNAWEPADMEKLQPYDLVMNKAGTASLPADASGPK